MLFKNIFINTETKTFSLIQKHKIVGFSKDTILNKKRSWRMKRILTMLQCFLAGFFDGATQGGRCGGWGIMRVLGNKSYEFRIGIKQGSNTKV